MTKSYSIDYGGKTYTIDGPDNATQEQVETAVKARIGQQSGNTRGGDLARGLAHGLASGLGLAQGAPEGSSGWRETGETIGEMAPGVAAGFIPGAGLVRGGIGASTGLLQPAKDWKERLENAGIGAASAELGGLPSKLPSYAKSALDHLAERGIGAMLGHGLGLGNWGAMGGQWVGRSVGQEIEKGFGNRGGLFSLMSYIASNPGLAAYLGIKASPYVEQAGQFVGEELGKPSQ